MKAAGGIALGVGLVAFGNALGVLDYYVAPIWVRSIGAIVLATAVLVSVVRKHGVAGLRGLGLRWKGLKESLPSGLAYGVALGSPGLISGVMQSASGALSRIPTQAVTCVGLIAALAYVFGHLLAGTAYPEEVLFRGKLLAELEQELPTTTAIPLSALFWALWHVAVNFFTLQGTGVPFGFGFALLSLLQLAGVFLGGLFLGWLRHREQNLAACMLAHWLLDMLLIGAPMVLQCTHLLR